MIGRSQTALKEMAFPAAVSAVQRDKAQPEILVWLRKLDLLLKSAIARARVLFAGNDADFALHGLYISESEVDALLAAETEFLGSDHSVARARLDLLSVSPLGDVGEAWSFTDFDRAVLLLALAPEIDLRYERIYAYLQDDVTKRRPTVDLALNLLCGNLATRLDYRARFAADAPLLRSGMLRLTADPAIVEPPLLAHYLRLDERAVGALLSDDRLDSRLAAFCERDPTPTVTGEPRNDTEVMRRRLLAIATSARLIRLLFSGPATSDKQQAAAALAEATGKRLLRVDFERSTSWKTDPIATASLLVREAALSDAILYLNGPRPSAGEETTARTFLDTLAASPVALIVASDAPSLVAIVNGDQFFDIAFALPDHHTRGALWRSLTADASMVVPAEALRALAGTFVLAPQQIATAVDTAKRRLEWQATAKSAGAADGVTTELLAAARHQTGLELAALTSKVEPVHRWQDIVLPDDSLQQLREICSRVTFSHRVLEDGGFGSKLSSGKGVAVLFAGPSGTGKTMAAEIIANELGLDLFRIDLSRVVSKYIGETEQNLERIFKAAVRSNSVLLFDEADALMGKRSAVHDAHDRYANIEISYLLQKMEQHEGVTILTTNLRGNIDDAFLRRLAFMVQFPFPDEDARREIWKRIWPLQTLVGPDVDVAALATRFRLSGGNIRNIGLSAAFLAATESRPVCMADILHAIRREYAKVGKNLTPAELEERVN